MRSFTKRRIRIWQMSSYKNHPCAGKAISRAEERKFLVALLLIPEAAEAVKQLILLAWAAGEGVIFRTDLRFRKTV